MRRRTFLIATAIALPLAIALGLLVFALPVVGLLTVFVTTGGLLSLGFSDRRLKRRLEAADAAEQKSFHAKSNDDLASWGKVFALAPPLAGLGILALWGIYAAAHALG